jgi:hypothetical protein
MLHFRDIFQRKKGIALFVSILLSMGLSVISLSAMLRISSVTQTTGESLRDKRLLMYAESAVAIAAAEVQVMATNDAVIGYNTVYNISGTGGDFSFRFYPQDVSLNPATYYDRTLFAYRAVARRFAGAGSWPPGFSAPVLQTEGQCFDITVDVREVIYIEPVGGVAPNVDAQSSFLAPGSTRYFMGKTKTVGVINCFITGPYGGGAP